MSTSTWRTVQSFRMKPEVQKLLDEIPWGEKSDFINEAILKLIPNGVAGNPSLPNQKPQNGKLRTEHSPSENLTAASKKSSPSSRTSNDQEASANQPSKTRILNILRNSSSAGQ